MNQEERVKRAEEKFKSGCNCSQSVLLAYCDLFGVEEKTALALAAGFGAGIGGLQKACGAVSGAVMLIGLRHYADDEVSASKRLIYEKVRDFVSHFEEKNGSAVCLEIIGVDLSTEEGAAQAREEGLFETKCGKAVRDACHLVAEHLL